MPANTATASPTQRGVPDVCAMVESWKSLIYFFLLWVFTLCPDNLQALVQRVRTRKIRSKICRILGLRVQKPAQGPGFRSTSTRKVYTVYVANVIFAIQKQTSGGIGFRR